MPGFSWVVLTPQVLPVRADFKTYLEVWLEGKYIDLQWTVSLRMQNSLLILFILLTTRLSSTEYIVLTE